MSASEKGPKPQLSLAPGAGTQERWGQLSQRQFTVLTETQPRALYSLPGAAEVHCGPGPGW